MKHYIKEILEEQQLLDLGADLSKDNEIIVETAGFEPLDVKLKRFEQAGLIAQFKSSDFTSSDMRELYMNPDFDITPEDDIEEVMQKLSDLKQYQKEVIQKIQERKITESEGNNVAAGTVEQKQEVNEEKSSKKRKEED